VRFPLWLSTEPLLEIRRFRDEGRCKDPVPSMTIVVEQENVYRAFAFLRIDDRMGVSVRTGMRAQHFTMFESDMLAEIIPFELAEKLKDVLEGRQPPEPLDAIYARANALQREDVMLRISSYGSDGNRSVEDE
jgi:hypothetical protein